MKKILMIRLLSIFILAILVFSKCENQKYPTSCEEILNKYYQLLKEVNNNNGTEKIITHLKNIIKANPHCINSYFLLGDIYFSLNQQDSAKIFYLKAIEVNPGSVYAIFKAGLIYEYEKKYDSAAIFFRMAAQEKTTGGFVMDKSKNLETVTGTPDFDIDYSEIIFHSGVSNFNVNHLENAMHELNYCIRESYNLKESFFYRGLIYLKIKDSINACQDMYNANVYGNDDANKYLGKYCK